RLPGHRDRSAARTLDQVLLGEPVEVAADGDLRDAELLAEVVDLGAAVPEDDVEHLLPALRRHRSGRALGAAHVRTGSAVAAGIAVAAALANARPGAPIVTSSSRVADSYSASIASMRRSPSSPRSPAKSPERIAATNSRTISACPSPGPTRGAISA